MNTTVWLISFTDRGEKVQKAHTHNCVADYRLIDDAATVQEIDCAAVAELIAAVTRTIRAFEAYGKAHGLVVARRCRIECEDAMVAQKAALANVGGAK